MNDLNFVTDCYPQCFQALNLPQCHQNDCYYAETGVFSPILNGVYNCSTKDEQLEKVIDQVTQHFNDKKMPHSWWVETSNEPARLPRLLGDIGLQTIGKFPGMMLHIKDFVPNEQTSQLEIQRVSTSSELSLWAGILGEAFSFTSEATAAYFDLFNKTSLNGPYYHLLGKVNGEVVCSGTVLCTENGAYIYNIATSKEARKKGYAREMTSALIEFAKERGMNRVALISSPEATELYLSLGFKVLTHYNIYIKNIWVM